MLAIDGFGASGKSSLAIELARKFAGVVIALDDFARPGTLTWEHERFIAEVLVPLRDGRAARYLRWPWDSVSPIGAAEIPAVGLVIVEGVSALTEAVTRQVGRWWDLSLWLDTPEAKRRQRIEERDGACIADHWEQQWWPSERRYFTTERPDLVADFVIYG